MIAPSRGFLETVALVACGGALALLLLARWNTHVTADESRYVADGRAWLAADRGFHADLVRRDSAIAAARHVLVVAAARQAQLARHDATLAAQVQALGRQVPAPASDLIATLRAEVEAAGIARGALEAQLGETRGQRDAALTRLAQGDSLVHRGVTLVKCRILWVVPCPSRTAAFVVGVGLGAAGSLALRR